MDFGTRHTLTAALTALALLTPTTAPAIDLGINLGPVDAGVSVGGGGVNASASVGGDDGINAGASVGGSGADVNASLGGAGGLDADVSLGGDGLGVQLGLGSSGSSTGGGTTNPNGTTGFTPRQATQEDLLMASRARCSSASNSTALDGTVVYDRDGFAMGVVHGAQVTRDMALQTVTFATSGNLLRPSACITLSADGARMNNGAILLPTRSNDVVRAVIASR